MNIEKLKRLQDQVRIGGKGTPRRKKKVIHQTTAMDDKKLQTSLKKIGVSTIPGIEEVNIIKDDLSVINFKNPKVQASLSSNTFALTGHSENKKVMDMLPEILPQLGQETVMQLRMFASSLVDQQKQANAALSASNGSADDDVPMLIGDFDEIARIEADKAIEQSKPQGRNIKEHNKKSDIKNKSNVEQSIAKTAQPAEEQNDKNTAKNKKQEKKNKKANKNKQNKLSKDTAGVDTETVIKSEDPANVKNENTAATIVNDKANNVKPLKDTKKDSTQKKTENKIEAKAELEQKKDTKLATKEKEVEQKKDTKSPPKDKKAVAKSKENKQDQNVSEIKAKVVEVSNTIIDKEDKSKKPIAQTAEELKVSNNIVQDALNSKGSLQQEIKVAAKVAEEQPIVQEKVVAKTLEKTNVETGKEAAAETKVISTPDTVQPNNKHENKKDTLQPTNKNENKKEQPLAPIETVQPEQTPKDVLTAEETKTDKKVEPISIQQEPEQKKQIAQTQEIAPKKADADADTKKPSDDVKPAVEAAVKVIEQQQDINKAVNVDKPLNVLEKTEVKPIEVNVNVVEVENTKNVLEKVTSAVPAEIQPKVEQTVINATVVPAELQQSAINVSAVPAEVQPKIQQSVVNTSAVPAEVQPEVQQTTKTIETEKSADVTAVPIAKEPVAKIENQQEKPAAESYAATLKNVEEKDLVAPLEKLQAIEKTIDSIQTKKNNENINVTEISAPTTEVQPIETIKSVPVETIESNIKSKVEAIQTSSNQQVTSAEGVAEEPVKEIDAKVKETESENKLQEGKPAANKKAPTTPGVVKQKSKPAVNTAETKKASATDVKKVNENTKLKQTVTPKSQKQQTTTKNTNAPTVKSQTANPKTPTTKAQEKPNTTEKPNPVEKPIATKTNSPPVTPAPAEADMKVTPSPTAIKSTDNDSKQDGNKVIGTPKKQTDTSKPKQSLGKNRTTSTSSTSSNKCATGSSGQGAKSTKSKQQKPADSTAVAGKK